MPAPASRAAGRARQMPTNTPNCSSRSPTVAANISTSDRGTTAAIRTVARNARPDRAMPAPGARPLSVVTDTAHPGGFRLGKNRGARNDAPPVQFRFHAHDVVALQHAVAFALPQDP